MGDTQNKYLSVMDFATEEEAYEKLTKWASGLSEREHTIRSCIFDLHAAVELELRRVYYHTFHAQLFLTDDQDANRKIIAKFEKQIASLGFGQMYNSLRPVLDSWPYDLGAIEAINKTRNQAAHENMKNVRYKGRDPFNSGDCFAQMYFEVWATQKEMRKFFDQAVMRTRIQLKRYVDKYGGDLL